ncbi:hypothetical protein TW84_02690 [Vibrio neptunius]|nr:hypothetical protein TW84_02690 [Vibrio neptunius]
MKILSNIINKEVSQSRRDFITYSSLSLIGAAAATVFPSPVIASMLSPSGANFEELDSLNFYVNRTTYNVSGVPPVTFESKTDEAQYLAQVIYQELFKYQFNQDNTYLSGRFGQGMKTNGTILALSAGESNSVNSVYNVHRHFFQENMIEYVSAILQNAYSTQDGIPHHIRRSYNSWDMIAINQSIETIEKGDDYKKIIDKLYVIAAAHCQEEKLTRYIHTAVDAESWMRKLVEHYKRQDTLQKLVDDTKIQQNTSSFETVSHRVYNTINKVRALNTLAQNPLNKDELHQFERTLIGALYSGFAISMKWGSTNQKEAYSVRNNKHNYDAVVSTLKGTKGKQGTFWNSFFNKYGNDGLWDTLRYANIENYTIQDSQVHTLITKQYPELAGGSTGLSKANFSPDSLVAVFTFLLAIGQFSWATATDREAINSPQLWTDLGMALADGTLNLIQLSTLFDTVASFIFGNGKTVSQVTASYMNQFSQFVLELIPKGKVLTNNTQQMVLTQLYKLSGTALVDVINVCFIGLAALGAALAAYNLYQAVQGGDIGDIIFASINMLVATVTLAVTVAAYMGLAIAGPLGIVVAVVGIIVAIAGWIYTLLKKQDLPPEPVIEFTNTYIKNRFEYQGQWSYICRARTYEQGNRLHQFNANTMDTDWNNMAQAIDDRNSEKYKYPGALVSSKDGNIYNFSDLKKVTYCKKNDFFTNGTGTNQRLEGFYTGYADKHCAHAVESTDRYGRSQAVFLAAEPGSRWEAYLTHGLTQAPGDVLFTLDWLNGGYDSCVDVVAINGLSSPTFIIFTRRHIYQVINGSVEKIISNFNGSQGVWEGQLTALTMGKEVHVFYSSAGLDSERKTYHYKLSQDENENYTQLEVQREIPYLGDSANSIVGRLLEGNGYDRQGRMDFICRTATYYQRFGARLNSNKGTAFSYHNGVKFTAKDDGFFCFFKNAIVQ